MKDTLSYKAALAELQAIVAALQSGEIKIDELAEKSKRAAELVDFCKTKLRSIEQAVGETLEF